MANTKLPSSRWSAWLWLGLCHLIGLASAPAQPSVPRGVTAGGGGAASAGAYTVVATTGQPAAGPASSAAYAVNEGFWGTFGSAPIPGALALATISNQPARIPVATLLAGSDADGDALSRVGVGHSSAQGGAVVLAAGIITYTPPNGFLGADSFNYTILDTGGDTAVGSVSVSVLPPIITVTTSADSGPGSLRQALAAINTAATNSGLGILFASGLAGQTILLSSSAGSSVGPSALVVSNAVSIDGSAAPGMSIGLNSLSAPMRLIFVARGAQLTLQNVTLQNGAAQGGAGSAGSGGGGGGAGLGGGIYNQGTITLNNVLLFGNQALGGQGGGWSPGAPGAGGSPNGGGGGSGSAGFGGGTGGAAACGGAGGLGAGGAIFNDGGTLNMSNCVVQNNLVLGGAGGAGASGCNGTNQNGMGAGLFNYNGVARLSGCQFTANNAGLGPGIVNLGDGLPSWVYLTQDTLTAAGSTNDFLSIAVNGGDAQTVEIAGSFDSQYTLWISPIPNVGANQINQPISVPVVLHPPGGVGGNFPLQAVSANTNLVTAANLVFSGSGTNFTLTITPAAGQFGSSLITVSAAGAGFSAAATFTATFGLLGSLSVSGLNRIVNVTGAPGSQCFVQYATSLSSPIGPPWGRRRKSRRGFTSSLTSPLPTPCATTAPLCPKFLSLAPRRNASISRKQNEIRMNGYFFTASATRSQIHEGEVGLGRTGCQSLIVCAGSAEEAQKRFEQWLGAQPEGESPVRTQIHKIVAAQFIDQLLTEKETVPIDWPQIARQAQLDLESIPVDDFEQGYWVDVNAVIGPSLNLEALREDLPDEVRSGLNWAEDKQSFFLLSVLSPPPPPPPEPGEDQEAGAAEASPTAGETAAGSAFGLDESEADFPELAAKEAAALIRARNSAVAAWLWRKYAADTPFAGNQIRIDPWFGVIGPEPKSDPDAAVADATKASEPNSKDTPA